MKVSVTLRRSRSKNEDIAFLYFRLRDKETDIKAASSITINPEYWDASVPGYAANTPKKVVPIERQQLLRRAQRVTTLPEPTLSPP